MARTTTETKVPKFFLILMAAATVLLGAVLLPYVRELLMAAVLAGMLHPLQVRLTKRLKRPGLVAGLLVTGIALLVLGPLTMVVTLVIRDGNAGVRYVATTARSPRVTELLQELPEGARHVVEDAIKALPQDMGEAVGQLG